VSEQQINQKSENPVVMAPGAAGEAQQSLVNQQAKVTQEMLKKESENLQLGWQKMLQLYAIPIIVIGIFAGIVFTLIIPSIGTIFAELGEADRLEEQVVDLNKRLAELEVVRSNSEIILADLATIEEVIPERVTEVVNFQQKITRIARNQYGLDVSQAETGETLLSSAVESPDNPAAEALAVIEIPSTFSMTGTLNDIRGFISAVQKTSDFIIIGEMELTSNESTDEAPIAKLDSGNWRLDITLIKYQFPVANENNNLEEIYSQVPPTVQINRAVIDYIQSKLNSI
jgi:Tfp pilus assembly protein PilO